MDPAIKDPITNFLIQDIQYIHIYMGVNPDLFDTKHFTAMSMLKQAEFYAQKQQEFEQFKVQQENDRLYYKFLTDFDWSSQDNYDPTLNLLDAFNQASDSDSDYYE